VRVTDGRFDAAVVGAAASDGVPMRTQIGSTAKGTRKKAAKGIKAKEQIPLF
jgi:hypothetical protein